jgi:hypothetical protein
LDGAYEGPGYPANEWVRQHGYISMSWDAIRSLWYQYNLLLTQVVDRIPENRFGAICRIGNNPPATLGFVVEDYVLHMQHHIDLLLCRQTVTAYLSQGLLTK